MNVDQELNVLLAIALGCLCGIPIIVLLIVIVIEEFEDVESRPNMKWSVLQNRHTDAVYVCPSKFERENWYRLCQSYIVIISGLPKKYIRQYLATQRLPEWQKTKG